MSEPVFLPAGTRLEAEAVFDNSRQNRYNPDPSQTVSWGFGQIEDEMLVVYLHHVELRGKDRKREARLPALCSQPISGPESGQSRER